MNDLHWPSDSSPELSTRHARSSSSSTLMISVSSLVAATNRLHEFFSLLDDDIKLGHRERACRLGIITGGLAPGSVAETSLASGFLAGAEIHSLREVHGLALSSMNHLDRQCAGCN